MMNAQEKIKELEQELEKLKKPTLVKINGIPQKVIFHGNFDEPRRTWDRVAKKVIWISAIPVIEVVDA